MIYGLSSNNLHYLTDDICELENILSGTTKREEYQIICFALAKRNTPECREILERQLQSDNKQKRFDALFYVFMNNAEREKYLPFTEEQLRIALKAQNLDDIKGLLRIISEQDLLINTDLLFEGLMFAANYASCFEYNACLHLPYTEDNFLRILTLFKKIKQREIWPLAENLMQRCEEKYFDELFEILIAEKDPRVNYYAAHLCIKFGKRDFNERLLAMGKDTLAVYGHIQWLVNYYLSENQ